VEEAPPAKTLKPVPSLREEEDSTAAPAVNLVSVPPIDANLMGVDLIILSGDSEDEVDWEALIAEDKVDWEVLAAEDDDIEFVVAGLRRGSDGGLGTLLLALTLMLA
jgi:hypothetical protein